MAYRNSTIATFTTATNIIINVPAGVVENDILLALIISDSGVATFTVPGGWELLQNISQGAPDGDKAILYRRIANSNEPASYTWVSSVNTSSAAIMGAWSGRNPGSIIISTQTVNTSSNATPISVAAAGVTALANDDVAWFGKLDQTIQTDVWVFAAPTNYTEQQDGNISWISLTLSIRDNVSAGATGTLTATATRSSGTGAAGWGTVVVSMQAAAGAPAAPQTPPVAWIRA